jgi:hypothetical protein
MPRKQGRGYRTAGRMLVTAAGAAALLLSVAAANAPRGEGRAARTGAAAAARITAALAVGSGDSPAGFWYGTDSWPMSVGGTGPYREPAIGGAYGGYIGMAGNWARWLGCGDKVAWSKTNSHQANVNHNRYHLGIGTGVYWFMGGPGVDPHYNGTAAEARAWGQRQAAKTLSAISHAYVIYPVVFADVELPGNSPGISPAPDNGWNSVYTSPCSGRVRSYYIAPSIDRAELNGFFAYLTSHSSYTPGVYSAPPVWSSIFGTGSASSIPALDEWTYTANTSSLTHHPSGWCLSGSSTCAHFFGGVSRSSPHALMWQWSGGGGTYNGYGDFDQIDANRTP